jgi:hypothetical protein
MDIQNFPLIFFNNMNQIIYYYIPNQNIEIHNFMKDYQYNDINFDFYDDIINVYQVDKKEYYEKK